MKPAFVPLSAGPVSVGARAWSFRGKTHLTVIVKAAFRLVQDRPMEVVNPVSLAEADVLRSANRLGSVLRPSDLALFVRHPEVLLDAMAFASATGAREAEQMKVRLALA